MAARWMMPSHCPQHGAGVCLLLNPRCVICFTSALAGPTPGPIWSRCFVADMCVFVPGLVTPAFVPYAAPYGRCTHRPRLHLQGRRCPSGSLSGALVLLSAEMSSTAGALIAFAPSHDIRMSAVLTE